MIKKLIIVLLTASIVMGTAQAAPKENKGVRKGNPWICGVIIVPRIWCYKWTP